MRFSNILSEAPLADISVHGEPLDREGSFSALDRRALHKNIIDGVYKKKLAKFPGNLYIYVLNQKGLELFGTSYPEGEITQAEIDAGSHLTNLFGRQDIPMDSSGFESIFRAIGINRRKDPTGIHFIIGDNFSDAHQIVPTAWIMVHRFCHTVLVGDEMIDKYRTAYGFTFKSCMRFLNFRSAREELVIDDIELATEIMTSYLITGKIPVDWEKFKQTYPKDFVERKEKWIALDARLRETIDRLIAMTQGKIYYI